MFQRVLLRATCGLCDNLVAFWVDNDRTSSRLVAHAQDVQQQVSTQESQQHSSTLGCTHPSVGADEGVSSFYIVMLRNIT